MSLTAALAVIASCVALVAIAVSIRLAAALRRCRRQGDQPVQAQAVPATPAGRGGIDTGELSHMILVGVLMSLGCSHTLDQDALDVDAVATPDGKMHALHTQPLDDGRLRISVVPRPSDDAGGTTFTRRSPP